MNMFKNGHVLDQLSPFLDGELGEEESAAVRAHLAQCGDCANELSALTELVGGLHALPASAITEERADALWRRIDAELVAHPIGESAWRRLVEGARRRWRLVGAGLALTATAAALALVLVRAHRVEVATAADETLWRDAESEFRSAEQHYRRAVEDLERLASREREGWPAERRARFDAALASLASATTSRRAAAVERDPAAEDALYRAYRDQIAFLEDTLLRRGAQ